ncbi:hypothetical protein [Pseudoalteromonas rubra]|uniref:Class I lanthipeptide n=1 Tax=Pseudoalteromonas rubra TaxID=43658 RepID=A0A5S3X4R7_9GAMM|nr:hypothetical protein [Pseudoalteromonas rubra]TMP39562.1 hypothetical protein CWB98_02950 [Pseudoalteromonas rubra]
MKLTLKKTKMKNLSQSATLKQNATPAVAGGTGPIIDNTPTRYLEGCDRHTYDWQYSCGLGATCDGVPV